MSLLRSLGLFVCRLYGDDVSNLTPIEKWSLKAAKLCSADDIISAAIIKSIALHYDDWIYTSKFLPNSHRESKTLTHTIRDVTVTVTWSENTMYDIFDSFRINNIPVSDEIGKQIRQSYMDIKDQRRRVKMATDKALAEQKRINEAWNLAEKLLGMKRNEFGALVPVKTVEEA